MSETDIVERLHAAADWVDQPPPSPDPPPSMPLSKMLRMAADEIEQLRIELDDAHRKHA